MRLLAELTFPGWRLRTPNEKRGRHWRVIRDWDTPPDPGMIKDFVDARAEVSEPHPRRMVQVVRCGPEELDDDNLHASIKPVLDRIKAKRVKIPGGHMTAAGYVFDDSPKYCRSVPAQCSGDYEVHVLIFED